MTTATSTPVLGGVCDRCGSAYTSDSSERWRDRECRDCLLSRPTG